MGETANQSEYAKFNSNGLKGVTVSEVKVDLNLNNVTNESKSTMFANLISLEYLRLQQADVNTNTTGVATMFMLKINWMN